MREGEGGERSRTTIRRRLAQLTGVRLGVAGLTVAVAAALGGAAGPSREICATAGAAGLATLVYGLLRRRVRRLRAFAGIELMTDLGAVTALVALSGGSTSIFAFLYVPITVYAAMVLGRLGAYGAASLASLAYGGVLLAGSHGWVGSELAPAAMPIQMARWGVQTAGLLLVALLASALSSERDRAGRALDERTRDLDSLRRLYERTVDSLTSGLLTTDLERRVTSFNPEAERITGVAAREVFGCRLEQVIPEAEPVLEASEVPRGAGRVRARVRFRNRRGQERHLGLASSILREPDGQPTGYVVIFQDVTRVVEMERELRRRERLSAAGSLAASLAHEIRNPLAAISGSIQMLQREATAVPPVPEAERLMDIVLRETDRLDVLLSDFLHYARPAAPRREAVALDGLVAEALKIFESVRPANVTVHAEVPAGLSITADPSQLRQLFWNLFHNAVDAMPEGGGLRVVALGAAAQAGRGANRSGEHGGETGVEILVADTGVGIADDDLDRVFDPFYTTKSNGTGLGLATVHRIVEAHGGELGVESLPGQGTTFRMRFPEEEKA